MELLACQWWDVSFLGPLVKSAGQVTTKRDFVLNSFHKLQFACFPMADQGPSKHQFWLQKLDPYHCWFPDWRVLPAPFLLRGHNSPLCVQCKTMVPQMPENSDMGLSGHIDFRPAGIDSGH